MTFDIGDKVQTNSGLYISGEWREAGLKGKVVKLDPNDGLIVKFKGIADLRFIRPMYLTLRKKANRPFKKGDTVTLKEIVRTNAGSFAAGAGAEVTGLIPDSNLVTIAFLSGTELTVAEEVLSKTAVVEDADADEGIPDLFEVKDNPEVQAALALVLERIEEIKALLTYKPQQEIHLTFNEASFVTEEEEEEEPAPEPVFKKAKEVVVGDLLYTEGGAYDKVHRVETKDSGYTSLFGAFGNKIVQVPSGRPLKVLEEVS